MVIFRIATLVQALSLNYIITDAFLCRLIEEGLSMLIGLMLKTRVYQLDKTPTIKSEALDPISPLAFVLHFCWLIHKTSPKTVKASV